MKKNKIYTFATITLVALISMSCMLFQRNRDVPDRMEVQIEEESGPELEEPASPAESGEPDEDAGELINQWAVSAKASSSYGDPDWAAIQATGEPDTNECADAPTAWASAERTGVDWLELYYEKPVYAKRINIVQTHSPNQVTKVDVIDTDGNYYTIYSRDPEVMECPFTLTLSLADTDYQVIGVKLTVDQSILDPTSWNEIDAVELVGRYTGSEVADMPPADSPPAEEAPTGDFELPDLSPSSLDPGSFYYEVVGGDNDKTVDSEILQYQSTSDEYVIGLISEDMRYSLSLFLPLDLSTGSLPLIPYESGSFSKSPTTAIYIGFRLYIADGGLVLLESVDDTITGSFIFVAHDKDDPSQVVTVSGAFNQIPLEE
jgi:hypothetical protein